MFSKSVQEALAFIKVIIRCCEALKEVMEEFADFRKSKTLHGLIIEINALEEEGDRLFIESMRRLHAEVTDPIEIIAWREIYVYLEKCCDACEHVAECGGKRYHEEYLMSVLSEQPWSVYIRIKGRDVRRHRSRIVGAGAFYKVSFAVWFSG